MQDPMEVYIDDEAKLTLHGLQQHYVKLKDSEKNRKLFELLDVLEFNQVSLILHSHQHFSRPSCEGRHLREVCPEMCRSVSAADRTELPSHRHTQGDEPRGETLQISAVQGFPEENPGGHQPLRTWHGH